MLLQAIPNKSSENVWRVINFAWMLVEVRTVTTPKSSEHHTTTVRCNNVNMFYKCCQHNLLLKLASFIWMTLYNK